MLSKLVSVRERIQRVVVVFALINSSALCFDYVRPSFGEVYVLECDNQQTYTVKTDDSFAWFFHPTGTRMLSQGEVENGFGYSDSLYVIWFQGKDVTISNSNGLSAKCRNNNRQAVWEKAKLDGVDFRAIGNEPGWKLELRDGNSLLLVTDYGSESMELVLPEPVVDENNRTTTWEKDGLIVKVIGHTCTDVMSGEKFPAEVNVIIHGKTLKGCGRALH